MEWKYLSQACVNLKINLPVISPEKKWVYSGTTEDSNLGQATHAKTTDTSAEQRGRVLFCRGRMRVGKGYYKQKIHWYKLGAGSVMVFHWLSYDYLSLAGLLPGGRESLSSSC